jgi:hypothetical protein
MLTAKKQISSLQTISVLAAIFVVFAARIPVGALAADLTQAFKSNQTLAAGTIVSIDGDAKDTVVAANEQSGKQIVGVIVAKDGSLLSIDSTDTSIQVAVSGRANVLVSDIYGDIKTGDLVSESPLTGLGAKAKAGSKVVGVAQADFNQNVPNVTSQSVKQVSGSPKEVAVGSIPIVVAVGQAAGGLGEGNFGSGLKGALSNIAGKQVSSARVIMTGFIAVVTLTVLITMVFAAIRTGIMGTSRNPLAKPAIFESLAQVMAMIVLICVISITMSYAVLRL